MAEAKMPDGFQGMLDSGYFSDLSLICDGHEWKVHKVIVCAQSGVFMKACNGNFKEAKENQITLKDDDTDVVYAMLQFLYKREYQLPGSKVETAAAAKFHVSVYNISDKYHVDPLGVHVLGKFERIAKNLWEDTSFAEITELIYTTGPSGSSLRSYVAKLAATNAEELLGHGDHFKPFQHVAASVPELAYGIALSLVPKHSGWVDETDECPTCDFS